MTFQGRRILGILLGAVVLLVVVVLAAAAEATLRQPAVISGWVLAGLALLLTLYNLRKKLAYPPLLRSSTWLQIHVYTGLLAFGVFFLHAGFRWPGGVFDTVLYLLFLAVALTGIIGLLLSRSIPKRLTARGQEVIYERIPGYRRELAEEARQLVEDAVKQHDAVTLADFYRRRLLHFFAGPAHRVHHLLQSGRPLNKLLNELRARHRYMSEPEQSAASELETLIEAKDDLDYHHVLQGTLKLWLFVHVPLTYAMLACFVLHVLLIYSFKGTA